MDGLYTNSSNISNNSSCINIGKVRSSNSICENLASRVSAEEMDEKRQQNIAYEYLCHLEEAKK